MQLVVHAPFRRAHQPRARAGVRKRFCTLVRLRAAGGCQRRCASCSRSARSTAFRWATYRDSLRSRGCATRWCTRCIVTPMFAVRWRWNLNRALAVLRMKGGKKHPPAAPAHGVRRRDGGAVFPRWPPVRTTRRVRARFPDHALVRQTLHDCLHEAMDVPALGELLARVEAGELRVHFRDTTEPSPLTARDPERAAVYFSRRRARSRSAAPARWRCAAACPRACASWPRSIPRRSPGCARRCARAARRRGAARHAALAGGGRTSSRWEPGFGELARDGRAARVATAAGGLWCATEQRARWSLLFPGLASSPTSRFLRRWRRAGRPSPTRPPPTWCADISTPRVRARWPALAEATRLSPAQVEQAVARLEAQGFPLRGSFSEETGGAEEVCARRLLARIHSTRTSVCAARSSRSPRRISCASCCVAARRRPARSARDGAGCWR